jgi:hypothetical protein
MDSKTSKTHPRSAHDCSATIVSLDLSVSPSLSVSLSWPLPVPNTDPKVKLAKKNSATPSRFDERNEDTFGIESSGGGSGAIDTGWSVQDMFAVNSRLTGQTYSYDGNPHNFGDRHPQYVKYTTSSPACASPSTSLEKPPSTDPAPASSSRSIYQSSSSSSSLPKPPFPVPSSASGDSSNHKLISKTQSLFSQMNATSPPSPLDPASAKTQYFPSPFVFETQKILRQVDSSLGLTTGTVGSVSGKRGRKDRSE